MTPEVEHFLRAYAMLSQLLATVACVLWILTDTSQRPRFIQAIAILIFSLGWPIVLPVVAAVLWRREVTRPPG